MNLTDIIHWSHLVLAEVLKPGDLAVDLTAGNGNDTLFLWKTVGSEGCVIGFDIQQEALDKTTSLLKNCGAYVGQHSEGPAQEIPHRGVHLVLTDHARLAEFVERAPKAIIANLGYLPGSDHEVVTKISTTLPALEAGLKLLTPGGRMAVVCYVGHPGGRDEADAVEKLLSGQPKEHFSVLVVRNLPAENAPYLLVAEKLML